MSSSATGIKHGWKFGIRGGFSWSQITRHVLQSCWLDPALGRCPPGTSGLWHRFAIVEQVWVLLTAPIVWLGFVGCSEPWQPGTDAGNACGVAHQITLCQEVAHIPPPSTPSDTGVLPRGSQGISHVLLDSIHILFVGTSQEICGFPSRCLEISTWV